MSHSADTANKHIVITGASSGLGAAIANFYAPSGATLTLLGRSNERLDTVAARCRSAGATVDVHAIDMRDTHLLAVELKKIDDAKPIDILIANAGIGGSRSVAGDMGEDPDYAIELAAVNFTGTIATVAPLVPAFVQRKAGHIVIISSLAAWTPMPLSPAYASSKAGISIYAKNLRHFLRRHGVAVTIVLPGFVRTPMSEELAGYQPGVMDADKAAKYIATAIQRKAKKLEFPWSVAWLTRLARFVPPSIIDFVHRRAQSASKSTR